EVRSVSTSETEESVAALDVASDAGEGRGWLAGAMSRREMMKATGVALGGLAFSDVLSACGLSSSTTSTVGTIKIGYVSPLTGPAAGFGEPDPYVISLARKAFSGGLTIGGTNYQVQIINKNGQPTPSV